MDPNVFDSAYASNPNDNALTLDIAMTNSVIRALYEVKGGDRLFQDKKNKDRLVQIDRYYIAKFQAETRILQTVVFFCCLALIGTLLYNKQLFSLLFYTIYICILFLIMFFFIARDLFNIFLRDSTNFDEYDHKFLYSPGNPVNFKNTYNDAELSNLPTCAS